MANEATKTSSIWNGSERALLRGKGIDIGCGRDPIFPNVRRFDVEHGDANYITRYVHDEFDFVFSSHCLEHMQDPRVALLEWWQLVRPGGVLFFLVPDEDLYEQGVFPSRFNPDHKATFTISKRTSWSPVSHNILDLIAALPGAELINIQIQDMNYDRCRLRFGGPRNNHNPTRLLAYCYYGIKNRLGCSLPIPVRWLNPNLKLDQTLKPGVFAQIQTIVRKHSDTPRPGTSSISETSVALP